MSKYPALEIQNRLFHYYRRTKGVGNSTLLAKTILDNECEMLVVVANNESINHIKQLLFDLDYERWSSRPWWEKCIDTLLGRNFYLQDRVSDHVNAYVRWATLSRIIYSGTILDGTRRVILYDNYALETLFDNRNQDFLRD